MEKPNWEILSVTRFFLASIVMIGHLQSIVTIGFLKYFTSLGSFEAILGFLLISGFSIGKSIMKNSDSYFRRRVQRIYPVYLASIAFQIIIFGFNIRFTTILVLIANLLFLNQIVTNTSFVGPAWTLAAEVALYALAPFFLRQTRITLVWLIFSSFILYLSYTCGRTLLHWDYYAGTMYGINIPILAFIWIAGFVLALFPTYFKQNARIIALLFAGHLAITVLIQSASRVKHHAVSEIFTVDSIGFMGNFICLLLVYLVVINNDKIRLKNLAINKIFNVLGNISYPMYLTHFISFKMGRRLGFHNPYSLILIAMLISCIIYYAFDFYSKRRKIAI